MIQEMFEFFNSLSAEKSIISKAQNKFILSMAQVGKLKNLKKGSNPYYLGKQQNGVVDVPDELFKLLQIPGEIDVWYYGDSASSSGRGHAFELRVYGGDLEAPQVSVFYGVVSGIVEIVVHSARNNFVCKVPVGFNIDSLVELLSSGSLLRFVLDNCRLSKGQKERLLRYGL